MSERDETTFLIKNAKEFSNFLHDHKLIFEGLKEKIPAVGNFPVLAKTLAKKPCSCSGVDVEKVMKKRRELFVNFYVRLFSDMDEETLEYLRDQILKHNTSEPTYTSITIMNEENLIVKI